MKSVDRIGVLLPRGSIFWLGGMVVVLAFVATVGLGTMLGLRRDGATWDSRVLGRLTVQIMPEGLEPPAREIPAAMAVLKSYPGIVSADLLSKSDNAALLAPWIGQTAVPDDLPFPALIDVKLVPGTAPDIPDLQRRLLVSAPHAVVDDHRQLTKAMAVPNPALWMSALLFIGSVCSLLFVLLSSIRARIAMQWQYLELFQLLGATEWRIAKLFAITPVVTVATASVVGTLLAGFPLALRAFSAAYAPAIIPGVSAIDLAWLAFIPVGAAIIGLLMASLLVISALRRG